MKILFLKIFLVALALGAGGSGCGATDSGSAGNRSASTPTPVTAQTSPTPNQPQQEVPVQTAQEAPTYHYELVNTYPHDRAAFTQGLIYDNGTLLESTGQYGASSLRRVELKTGRVLKSKLVTPQYFAEGMTLFRGRIYQLTWTTRKGFVYDPASFDLQKEFSYDGEGWGLTHDADSLILSDGTNQIRFLDPETLEVKRTISVTDKGRPLRELNELEFIKGEIYANIWHTDRIVRIDPRSGQILGWIDLTGLLPDAERYGDEAVLNGIAYDEAGDRLFVTGKLWPKLFEIRLKR
jgi:glutamine cyclotransferase